VFLMYMQCLVWLDASNMKLLEVCAYRESEFMPWFLRVLTYLSIETEVFTTPSYLHGTKKGDKT